MKFLLGISASACVLWAGACATSSESQGDSPAPSGGASGAAGAPSTSTGGGLDVDDPSDDDPDKPTPNCRERCADFPAEPVLDDSGPLALPDDVASLFDSVSDAASGGPCVLEPSLAQGAAPGALLPANWLEPRVRFVAAGGENVFEIRFSTPREANELVVYTTNTIWTMPRSIWLAVARNVHREPITVTVRARVIGSTDPPTVTRGSFQIAPVFARGSLVYWATTSQAVDPDTSKLVGFSVGDDSVVDALDVASVGNRGVIAPTGIELRTTPDANAVPEAGHVQCIGCHVSTPDGKAVVFTDLWPWNGVVASIEEESSGEEPEYVTEGAARLLGQPWLGMTTTSKGAWSDERRFVVSSYATRTTAQGDDVGFDLTPKGQDGLAWFDLLAETDVSFVPGDAAALNADVAAAEGTGWGRLALTGETRSAVAPSFSHDGQHVVYTSADVAQDGRIGAGNAEIDLHRVPFAEGEGGVVEAVSGASEPGVAEYYPSFSADDRLLAFNRLAQLDAAAVYYRAEGEIFVVPSEGTANTAVRLAANDPVACSGETSPGVINSWAKWSPSVVEHEGERYYFLVFSSARAYPDQGEIPEGPFSPPDRRMSQLYVTTVVEDVETGELDTFGAVYLWNQDTAWSNLTPAWDVFRLPPVVPR